MGPVHHPAAAAVTATSAGRPVLASPVPATPRRRSPREDLPEDAPAAKLEIRLLGPPRVLSSGRILPIRRRKALALVAFLASNRVPHTRQFLAAMFWPDADRESAQAQIRNHVWVLRAAGLAPWLSVDGEMIELREGEDLWIDVSEHRRLLGRAGLVPGRRGTLSPEAEPSLSEAVEIYQKQFLAGFHLSDSLAFDEWQLREEETLRSGLGAALDALIRLREERGDLEGAVASACRRMELDPLDEGTLRTLMNLYMRAGRRRDALLWYERTTTLLERELDLAPARETVLLRNQILARPAPHREDPEAVSPRSVFPDSSRTSLPESPTPCLGREAELELITRHLEEPGLRLLTLTGPGGCGKSRLALEAGRSLRDRFPDGVALVSLTSARTGKIMPPAPSEVCSLHPGSRDPAPSSRDAASSGSFGELVEFLRNKQMLLILDNLEQIANDPGPLREFLTRTRRPIFLATSRVHLRLAGEQVMEVEGLSWPKRTVSAAELPRYPSVRLFLQTVGRMRPLPNPSPAELQAAGEICRRLRGHPLAIELAASWAQCLSVEEIAEQLADSLDLNAAPRTDIPLRHRSLRAVFAQSWALLSPEERTTFRRLCLAPGPFDRRAAVALGRTTPGGLAALIEQSMLRRTRDDRFEIPEILRQFGLEPVGAGVRATEAVPEPVGL